MSPATTAAAPPTATPVCITGASGFIGSWLVMRLLEHGYIVRATVRDPGNLKKVKHLIELPKADTNLTLWEADMNIEGSYDEAIRGCECVFHMATPMDFESNDPENEVIKPTVDGMMNIMRSCANVKTVKKLIFTTSAGTLNVEEHQKPIYDETSWSDLDFILSKKMTGWMYFVSKIYAEKAAMEVAKESNINFISVIPPLVVGPFIMPTFPPSLITALSPITGNEAHYSIIKQGQFVHVDDICEALIFLFEQPNAQGRYICSSHDATIYDIANLIRHKWPQYHIPTQFEGIDKDIPLVRFSSKKLTGMGFSFKYTLEDMYTGAIETCREKGLLPHSTKIESKGENKESIYSDKIEANGENKESIYSNKQETEESICFDKIESNGENKESVYSDKQETQESICSDKIELNGENKESIYSDKQETEESICSDKIESKGENKLPPSSREEHAEVKENGKISDRKENHTHG